jgi:hypothetical protein
MNSRDEDYFEQEIFNARERLREARRSDDEDQIANVEADLYEILADRAQARFESSLDD